MRSIPENTFLIAAKSLANMVSNEDLEKGNLYPPLQDIQKCSLTIAVDVMKYGYENGKIFLIFLYNYRYNIII